MDITIFNTFVIIGILTGLSMTIIDNIQAIRSGTEQIYINESWTKLIGGVLLWGCCLALYISRGFEDMFDALEVYFYGELNTDSWRWVDYSFVAILVALISFIKIFTLTLWKFSSSTITVKQYLKETSSSIIVTICIGLMIVAFFEIHEVHNYFWSVGLPSILVILPSLISLYKSDTLDLSGDDDDKKTNAQDSLSQYYMKLTIVNLIWGILIVGGILTFDKLLDYYTAGYEYRIPLALDFLYCLFCVVPLYYIYRLIFNYLNSLLKAQNSSQ